MARNIGLKTNNCHKTDWHHTFCTTNYAPGEHFAITGGMDGVDLTGETKEVICSYAEYDVWPACIIENTRHRDGSIYKRDDGFVEVNRIADRGETQLEPMMLSEPTNCQPDRENCILHSPSRMMQIFSLRLAKIPIGNASIQLYGYIAVRDYRDLLLNYIVNRSRDEPIEMQQGCLIEMTGPKRGISMRSSVLVEFDMRIKNGDQEEEDLQLIDGIIDYCELGGTPCWPFTNRIYGDCGAVDITLALVYRAFEATIEVFISEVQNNFHLSLSSFVSVHELLEEIRLFHGNISESCSLRRCVVAVVKNTWMHLKFKVGQNGSKGDFERYVSFKADPHGCTSRQVRLDLANISVKVTWSAVPM